QSIPRAYLILRGGLPLLKLEGEFESVFLDPAMADGLTQWHEDVADRRNFDCVAQQFQSMLQLALVLEITKAN
ncbi:hypothetical protein HJC23_010268, partial [Cyclotella cryptica]